MPQLVAALLTLAALAVVVMFLSALARTPWTGLRARLAVIGGDAGAVDLFIPKMWSAELLTTLLKNYVLADAANRDYEGEIANAGDTVHIGSLSDPTVSNYTKNVTVIDPQTLTTTDQSLVIDQSKYFAFEVDDVDMRQVRDGGRLMTTAAQRAAIKMQEAADTYVGTIMTANAGTILTPAAVSTVDQAFKVIVNMRVALDRANVPQTGRWLAVSPEFYGLLLQDARFINAQAYGNNQAITNGVVGGVLGFTIKVSTNLPTGTAATAPAVSSFIIAGHSIATTFADQISKVEAYRPNNSFSDAVKGLHLYGAKVIRPEALVVQDVDVTV
ncbi:MAG: phage major capsid protein [Blastococcus sp.]